MHSEAYRKSIAVKRGSHNPQPSFSLSLSDCTLTLYCSLYLQSSSLYFPSTLIVFHLPFLLSALTLSCVFPTLSSSSVLPLCLHLLSPTLSFLFFFYSNPSSFFPLTTVVLVSSFTLFPRLPFSSAGSWYAL